MKPGFKRVPALDKGIAILELISRLKEPLGVTDISKSLNFNKSTVFNIVHTFADLGILEKVAGGRFQFGTRLYVLGRAAGRASELISIIHPYLEKINQKTKLSAFLGIRSGSQAVIIDKVDTAFDIKIHSEIGMRIPLLAGAGGKAFLAQLSEAEVDDILQNNKLKKFTPNSCVNKNQYKKLVKNSRRNGIAIDMEEYIEGIRGLAVPLDLNRPSTQAVLWAVGLKRQITDQLIPDYSAYLVNIANEIGNKFTSQ